MPTPRTARLCVAWRCGSLTHSLTDPKVEIISQTPALFAAALTLYRERADKAWSLTDCMSFSIMKTRGIKSALAHDRHFEQAGFKALLRG